MLTRDLSRVFAVLLVMACPCATILAASTAVSAALANAADNLMLIKGGLYLERFSETDCFCFDKTGTVTRGIPEVSQVAWNDQLTNLPEMLGLAASAEFHNPHPLGQALVRKAQEENYQLVNDALVENVLGRGVQATMGVNTVMVGNRAFMIEEDVATTAYQATACTFETKRPDRGVCGQKRQSARYRRHQHRGSGRAGSGYGRAAPVRGQRIPPGQRRHSPRR